MVVRFVALFVALGFLVGAQFKPQPEMTIVDEQGLPIPDAKILIGKKEGLFPGNFLKADSSGKFAAPTPWTNPEIVTIDAKGYVRSSFAAQMPEGQTFVLHAKEVSGVYQVRGQLKNFQQYIKEKDGWAEFGMLIPALRKRDALTFDLSKILSPWADAIEVKGRRILVPSNISLPRQAEKYLFFNFELNKPIFTSDLRASGSHRLLMARGRAKIGDLIDKKGWDVLNALDFQGGGFADVTLQNGGLNIDLAADDFSLSKKIFVNSPFMGKGFRFFVIPMSQDKEHWYPTDLKVMASGTREWLKVLDSGPQTLVSILLDSSETGFSLQMTPIGNSLSLLPIAGQVSQANGVVTMNPPGMKKNLVTLASVIRVSEVMHIDSGTYSTQIPFTEWEIYIPSWEKQFEMPEFPGTSPLAGKILRWETLFLAAPPSQVSPDMGTAFVSRGNDIMEFATHVSRNAKDY